MLQTIMSVSGFEQHVVRRNLVDVAPPTSQEFSSLMFFCRLDGTIGDVSTFIVAVLLQSGVWPGLTMHYRVTYSCVNTVVIGSEAHSDLTSRLQPDSHVTVLSCKVTTVASFRLDLV
jgi:hypothetical protein